MAGRSVAVPVVVAGECPFCDRVIAGDYDAAFHEYGQLIAVTFEPLNPVAEGHRLYVPARHIRSATEDPRLAGVVFAHAAADARHRMVSMNLITSVGIEATQSVFHLHIHAVPRWPDDGLTLPWTGQKSKAEARSLPSPRRHS